jgi:hypothetical protein
VTQRNDSHTLSVPEPRDLTTHECENLEATPAGGLSEGLVLVLLVGLLAVLRRLRGLGEHAQHLDRPDARKNCRSLRRTSAAHELDRKTTKASRYLIYCFPHVRNPSGGVFHGRIRGCRIYPG